MRRKIIIGLWIALAVGVMTLITLAVRSYYTDIKGVVVNAYTVSEYSPAYYEPYSNTVGYVLIPVYEMNPLTGMLKISHLDRVRQNEYHPLTKEFKIQTTNKKGKTVYKVVPVSIKQWNKYNIGDSIYYNCKNK